MSKVDVESPGTPDHSTEIEDEQIKQQYELLSIMDSKAAALLTFNAVALTALSVWLSYVSLNVMHFVLDLVFVIMLVSCALLLGIIALRWARSSDDLALLQRTRQNRSRQYKTAWVLAISGVLLMVVVSAVHAVGTGLMITNSCGDVCSVFFSEEVFGNVDYQQ